MPFPVDLLTDGLNPSAPAGSVHVYTSYELMGVKLMAAAGVVSCVFVSILLLYIAYSAFTSWYFKKKDTSAEFTSKQIAVFITCLLISDLIQSISGITQVKWANEKKIYDGHSCTIQAVTLVMGDLGSTVWSCVIAAHTFSGIALGKHWPRWAVISTVVVGWAFVILLTFIPPIRVQDARGPYFSIAGTWCFISSEYAVPRLVIHYVPLFAAVIILFGLYSLIFLFLRGTIGGYRVEGSNSLIANANEVLHRQRINVAKRMLWYPIAYLACIFPIAIVRLVGLKDEQIPEPVWIFSMFFLFSLGAVDSIIYATTRKMIKPINLPFHMVSLSNHGSGSNGQRAVEENISLEKRTSHIKRSVGNVKMTWSGEDLEEHDDSILKDSFDMTQQHSTSSARLGGIQITLERIQEVM